MKMINKKPKEMFSITMLSSLFKLYFFPLIWFGKKEKIVLEEYNGPAIYAIWHQKQYIYSTFDKEQKPNTHLLISPSNDGEAIAQVCHSIGFPLIRGSQKRQGLSAIRSMVRLFKQGKSVAFTVDGPKGPKYKVKEGLIKIAQLGQVPIIPINADVKHIEIKSAWDNYNLALLGFPIKAVFGEPIFVPKDATEEDLEIYRKKVENKLFELEKIAKDNT